MAVAWCALLKSADGRREVGHEPPFQDFYLPISRPGSGSDEKYHLAPVNWKIWIRRASTM